MKAGSFKAIKVGGDLGETSKGAPQVGIAFQLVDSGETITWYGYFTEKTEQSTLETLVRLGVKDDFSNIGEPSDAEFTLKIEEEQNDKGEMVFKVRWVNSGDGVAMQKRMDAAKKLQFGAKMAGKMALLRTSLGAPTNGANPAPENSVPWDT